MQARTPQAPLPASANGTSRVAGRDDKASATPADPTANTAALIAVPPVEVTPAAALPVPSPSSSVTSSVQAKDNNGAQDSVPAISTTGTQPSVDSSNARVVSAANSGQKQITVQNVKFDVETFDPAPEQPTQPDQPTGSPARAAQAANNGQDQPSVQDVKFAVEIFDPSLASTTQPEQPKNSSSTQSADTAGPSPLQTASPAALTLSSMILPDFGASQNANDPTLPATTAAQSSKASNVNLSKVAVNATASATDSPATSAAATTGTSTHSTQGNAQNSAQDNGSGQHTQGQMTQNQPTPQAPANSTSTAPQILTIAAHGTTHDALPVHSGDATAEVTRTNERTAQPEINETAATSGINTANVIQKMSESEMRVGMHSAEFGEISIRTTVSQQQMLTEISVDHGDLGRAISAHIPTLEAKLGGELGLRALVQVSQSGMSFSGERNSSPQREQRSFAQPAAIEGAASSLETDTVLPRAAMVAGNQYRSDRLDIRA